MKNDETFRRALISVSVAIKQRYEVVSRSQGELAALRDAIPYLMPGLLDALQYPFLDAYRIAHQDAISKKLEAYLRKQAKSIATKPVKEPAESHPKSW
jgi:hypothetical protein